MRYKLSYIALILIFLLKSVYLFPQNFQLLLDPINSAQSTTLFNLTVINQNNYSSRIELKATLRSSKGKLLTIQQITSEINGNEIKSFRGEGLNPHILFMDPNYQKIYKQNQMLPPMDYALCVELIVHSDPPLKIEECNNYKTSDFINLLPVYPNNKDILYENRPMFHWVDLSGLQGCNYELKLVKYNSRTNPNSALRRDLPVFQIKDIPITQLNYPLDADALEDGQSYVWQVTLNCYGESIISTEAWIFTYKEKDSLVDIPRNLSYVDINEIKGKTSFFAVGKFKFKYTSKIESDITIKIFEEKKYNNKNKNKEIVLINNSFEVRSGTNTYELDLKEQVYLKHLNDYILLIKSAEGEVFKLYLKYINPDYIK